ncbi:MAG: LysR substrate-binding domain-containing protein [Geminicoccaceae bacterium]
MRLPPLNALRAFEAAARHGSFVGAADELHVTQGAISRHIKLLEQHLGVALFRRRPQGITVTEAGQLLRPELAGAFERIARAAAQARDVSRELRVLAAPTFATRWLVPRLPGYQSRHPEQRITLGLFLQRHDGFQGSGFDVGITCIEGRDAARPTGLTTALLWQETMTPVCSPALLERGPPLAQPADLARHTLLHPTQERQDWRKWLAAAGAEGIDPTSGQTFATLDMAIGAAVSGMGVAMADLKMVQTELEAGTLVTPLGHIVEDGVGYLLLIDPQRVDEPKIAAFRDWIVAEASA